MLTHIDADREVRWYRKEDGLLLPRKPFRGLVREILAALLPNGPLRVSAEGFDVLQMAAEETLSTLFECANIGTTHRKKVTLASDDMKLALAIAKIAKSDFFGDCALFYERR